MYKLVTTPDSSGYSVTPGSEVIGTKLDGGASRTRVDILNAASTVTCQWTLGPEDYEYLRMFYSLNVYNGGEQFLIDLILDSAELTEYRAKIIPDTWKLVSQSGLQYVVSCNLEIEAIVQDYEYLTGIIMLMTEYGSLQEANTVLNLLEKLVNYDLAGVPYHA